MEAKEIFNKLKPLIIVILLFSIVFFIRAEAANLSSLPGDLKAFYQDDDGLPYFSEMDSYYNYRLTADYLDHGYPGDTKMNGKNWDLHSNYPPGRSAEYPPLIIYVTAGAYFLVNLVATVPLTVVSFWMSAFIGSLCVIPAYFMVRRLTNDYGGITAGLLVALAPAYFNHSFAGFFDTDMFNILLPLLVVWMLVESIRADDLKNKAIFAALSAVSMLIFSTAWEGWWYIFYIVVLASLVYLVVSRYLLDQDKKPREDFSNRKEWFLNQPVLLPLAIFVILGSVLMMISMGVLDFFNALVQPVGFTQLQESTQVTSYPNVYVSVAELQIPSISHVLDGVGGILAFTFGIISVFWLFRKIKTPLPENKSKIKKKPRKRKDSQKRRREKELDLKEDEKVVPPSVPHRPRTYLFMVVLLVVWLLTTAYAMTKGVRFIAAFSIPIAIGAGIFVGLVREYLEGQIETPSYRVIVMAILVAMVVFVPLTNDYAASSSVIPGADDSMVKSLTWIKANTPNNTVIISWWDYGHLFAAVADRPITFDGGSQNTPRAYWVGKALLTNNESLSAGILRMLSSSGDEGYYTLENYTQNTGKSVEILEKTLGVDKASAQTIMTGQYGLSMEQAQNVLKYTHPDNPVPVVFITSYDMIGKAGWWSYFGGWNFQNSSGQNMVYSLAPANITTQNDTLVLQGENGVVAQITSTNITAGIVTSNNQVALAHQVIVMVNGTTATYHLVSNQSTFSVMIIKEGDSYYTMAMNRELENSMFTRLFFLQGAGLTRFSPIHAQPGVIVWNVAV
ncbi:MAG: STT3 domain-containing protein [Euryarchaeota archaeon]|nr:STT3 domain-containing protein [Euryarchaeota archaeon]